MIEIFGCKENVDVEMKKEGIAALVLSSSSSSSSSSSFWNMSHVTYFLPLSSFSVLGTKPSDIPKRTIIAFAPNSWSKPWLSPIAKSSIHDNFSRTVGTTPTSLIPLHDPIPMKRSRQCLNILKHWIVPFEWLHLKMIDQCKVETKNRKVVSVLLLLASLQAPGILVHSGISLDSEHWSCFSIQKNSHFFKGKRSISSLACCQLPFLQSTYLTITTRRSKLPRL